MVDNRQLAMVTNPQLTTTNQFSENLTPLFSRSQPLEVTGDTTPADITIAPPVSIPSIKVYFLTANPANKLFFFESLDGKKYLVELPIAMQMQFFKRSFEGQDIADRSKIQVDFVYGDILAYVLYFCMVKSQVEQDLLTCEEGEGLCFGFVQKFYLVRDMRTIHNLLEAAAGLQVDLLRDLLCETIVKMVYEMTPEEVKEVFDVDVKVIDPTKIEDYQMSRI